MTSDDEPREASTSGDENNREQGVVLGDLDDALESHDYPVSSSELVDEYGDCEIEMSGGSQRLEEVLGLLDEDEQEFQDPESARQMIYSLVGTEGIGRENYSDRGGDTPEEGDVAYEDESF
ncbi:hypothetical protein [Halobacterium sp. R2-5]|uniref:DUF5789 family protein n=1 Tax=Halobacterium sp. R2-5 TaxID=2715751 RepID=UPI0014223D20|nr:hypothetical protein [Halobacterium sp. R2-5]NIB99570.1 hypothetical protein [Halobacterium sp. R2-5]